MNKRSALIIGSFQTNDNGFTGKLETLAVKAQVTFERNYGKATPFRLVAACATMRALRDETLPIARSNG